MRRTLAVLAALGLMLVLGVPRRLPPTGRRTSPRRRTTNHVQLLAINDLHGHLEPNTPGTIQTGCCNAVNNSSGVQTGWAAKTVPRRWHRVPRDAHQAAARAELQHDHRRRRRPDRREPAVSALFHDEPTIEAMNALQLDVRRRQPRVRRGCARAPAHAERRLPSDRRMPGRRRLRRRRVQVPRRERRSTQATDKTILPAYEVKTSTTTRSPSSA